MSVKLKVLSAGALFFLGGTMAMAQKTQKDTLKEKKIEEVVILGYGKTATKAKSVTSSTTISAEKLENRASSSFLSSMAGTAPGISVNTSSGSPGSGKIEVFVRGISSLSASTDPLYVIDGLMSSSTEFRNLNQNDIETLSILRDAQATAIYGNHGANGVVVITTKSGSFNSGVRVSYDGNTSFSSLPNHKYDLMSSAELLNFETIRKVAMGNVIVRANANNLQDIQNGNLEQFKNFGGYYGFDPSQNTDWRDVFTRVGFSQQHNIGVRSGGENFSSYSSLGYFEQEGTFKGTDFKRFTARTNINARSRDRRFTFSSQIGLGYSRRHQLDEETNSNISSNTMQNPLLGMVVGKPYWRSGLFANGVELSDATANNTAFGRTIWVQEDISNGAIKKRYSQTTITANANGQYEMFEGLKIGNKTGVMYKYKNLTQAQTPWAYFSASARKTTGAEYAGWENMSDTTDMTLNSVTNINYDKKIGNHSIGVAGYLDYLRGFYLYNYSAQSGLDPIAWAFGTGNGYIAFNPETPTLYQAKVSASKVKAGTLAYIATLDYDYSSKYGIAATIRRDGSYRFSDENKWETFWSVGGRWNIEKENFMKDSWFNMLKLRLSYGTNGNQNVSSGSAENNPLFLGSNLVREIYSLTTGYENAPAWSTVVKNSELRWEKIKQANIGLDFGLFRNKIEGTLDLYEKTTSDMYLSTAISGINGQFTIKGNNGTMRNRGVEASLKYTPFRNKEGLTLSVFANYSYNQNKIIDLPSEDLSSTLVNPIGSSAYQWNLYEYLGVNKDNGNAQYRAKDGSVTEKPSINDRQLTGKSVYAPHKGGFGFNVDYKGFYLSTLFGYQQGGWSQDTMHYWLNTPSGAGTRNVSRELLNVWTSTNNTSDMPSIASNDLTSYVANSDRYLYRTDFIKLKNVSVGYNLPKKMLSHLPMKGLKVYAMGENLFTFTKWKGFDPEPIKGGSLGVYPNAITYTLGMNVEF